MLAWLVACVNIFASSLVYVRIVPIEKTSSYYRSVVRQDLDGKQARLVLSLWGSQLRLQS